MTSEKIKTQSEIKRIAEDLKKSGNKVVTCNGSYDLMHIGHVYFLEEAKAQGDVLIVGLNSNESIHKYKSLDRPIIDEKYRAEMLSRLACVDYIVIMDEAEIARPLIKLVKPDVHANGAEYGPECVEAKTLKEIGGRLYLIHHSVDISTTKIISKIISIYESEKK